MEDFAQELHDIELDGKKLIDDEYAPYLRLCKVMPEELYQKMKKEKGGGTSLLSD